MITEIEHPHLEDSVGVSEDQADRLIATGRWVEVTIRLVRPAKHTADDATWLDVERVGIA